MEYDRDKVDDMVLALLWLFPVRSRGRGVHLGRTLHRERFMRPFVVELLNEIIELRLLLAGCWRRQTVWLPF